MLLAGGAGAAGPSAVLQKLVSSVCGCAPSGSYLGAGVRGPGTRTAPRGISLPPLALPAAHTAGPVATALLCRTLCSDICARLLCTAARSALSRSVPMPGRSGEDWLDAWVSWEAGEGSEERP